MKRLLMIPLLLTVLGCNNVKPPIEGRADPFLPKQIHVDSSELRRDTAFGTPVTALNESGLLVVTIPVRATINKTLYIDYRVTFFDRNSIPLGPPVHYTKTLDPNTPDRIVINATSPQAADFEVDFRYAR